MATKTGQGGRSVASGLATIRNLDYLVLLCEQVPPMRAFYEGVLGFPLHRDPWEGRWVELRVGSQLLTLRPRGWLELDGRPVDAPGSPGAASVQIAFRVPPGEVDRCHRELVAADVEIVQPPRDQPWGHRTLFARDPEDNLLEIYAEL